MNHIWIPLQVGPLSHNYRNKCGHQCESSPLDQILDPPLFGVVIRTLMFWGSKSHLVFLLRDGVLMPFGM